jgi:hypothetical protein
MKLFNFFQFLCTFLSSWIRIQPNKINADPDPNSGNLLYMIIYFIPVWNVCKPFDIRVKIKGKYSDGSLYLRMKEFSGSIDFFCGDSSVPEWDIPDGGDINVGGKRAERTGQVKKLLLFYSYPYRVSTG